MSAETVHPILAGKRALHQAGVHHEIPVEACIHIP